MDIRKLVGDNVNRLRKDLGMKQEPFSDAAGITQSYLSQIEHGRVNLTLFGLNDLCEALGVRPIELFRESEGEET
jgi:transcriptional regulator with XRE-family HTH domain